MSDSMLCKQCNAGNHENHLRDGCCSNDNEFNADCRCSVWAEVKSRVGGKMTQTECERCDSLLWDIKRLQVALKIIPAIESEVESLTTLVSEAKDVIEVLLECEQNTHVGDRFDLIGLKELIVKLNKVKGNNNE